jgi:Ion channel
MMHAIQAKRESALSIHRFFLLFVFLLAALILYPYAEGSQFTYYAFRVISSFAIVMSVYAAKIHRSLLLLAVVLAIPAIIQRVAFLRADAGVLSTLSIALSFVFDVVIVVVIARRVFAGEQPTAESIFGALCIYLMVAFSFAGAYGMITAFQPNAFYLDPHTNLHSVPDRFDFIYYSFGTITSLGAAGITPVSPHARSVSVLEAVLGVLYLAVLIARLMGAYRPTRNLKDSVDG